MSEKEFEQALPLALTLFKEFFNELTTATTNSIKNFEYGKWSTHDYNAISYYEGKRAAFAELSERIEKEYYLTANHARYICNPKTTGFCVVRDEDIEKMFPERDWHSRRDYQYCMKYRRALAELLEAYMAEGFRMGVRYQKSQGDSEPDFNPANLSEACIEAFVHPDFRKDK